MDNEPNTGNYKHHDQSERVYLETEINCEVTSSKPRPNNLLVYMLAFRQHKITDIDEYGGKKRQGHAAASYKSHSIFANFQPKKTVDDGPYQRKKRD
jgi:hypothetical protein